MTKEQLIMLGLDNATATKVAAASAEELKTYVAKTAFDEVNTAKKTLEEQVKEHTKQLETLKKSTGDAEALKKEITTLQESNKMAKTDYEAKIKQMQIDNAVEKALTSAKVKNAKAVRALLDLEKVDFDGDKIKGLDKQIKALREAEDSKFMFTEDAPPAQTTIVGMAPPASADPMQQNLSAGAQYAAMYNSQVAPTATK